MLQKILLCVTQKRIDLAQKALPIWQEEADSNWRDFEMMENMHELGLARRAAQLNAQTADRRLKILKSVIQTPVGGYVNLANFMSGRETQMIDSTVGLDQFGLICFNNIVSFKAPSNKD